MMKSSRYNIYDEEKHSYIANVLSGSHIQVTEEEFFKIKKEQFTEFSKEELAVLEENGVIVSSDLDEVQLLRNAYNFAKYTHKKATITIAPSLECNFKCAYCYEIPDPGHMDIRTQEQVLRFLFSLLEDNQISELNICWYGGEPLLHVDIIKKISEKMISYCNEKGIKYNASIITNGYLVDNRTIDIFKKSLITRAQITIDGSEKVHNARRKLINGSETYRRVENAILLLAENNISVNVRVNLDKSNINEYQKVYDKFVGKKHIFCYPAIVTAEENQNTDQRAFCYMHREFDEFYEEIYKDIYRRETSKIDWEMQPGIYNCAAEHAYSYLIAPDGYLYKCLNDICDRNCAVGHVSKAISNAAITAKYLGRDPFTELECEKCPYIPECYGGCIYEYWKHNTHACRAVKFMYKKLFRLEKGGVQNESNS